LFNSATVELFGFQDSDFCADPKLWVARIDERDRPAFISSWQRLQNGESKIVCRYRFSPLDASAAVEIVEDALLLPRGSGHKSAVWSRYQANRPALRKPGRTGIPVEKLLHQIGNYLQGIRGETDLLRLFNGLPQRSFDTITQNIDRIQNLVVQIDPAAGSSACEPRSPDEVHQRPERGADK
jgi:nitrogen-specific signal transduction histidine kinase